MLVQMKKVISMNYGSTTSSWKPWTWVSLDLIFPIRNITYIDFNLNTPITLTSSNTGTKFRDILQRNISQMITKTTSISTRTVISSKMKPGIPFWIFYRWTYFKVFHMIVTQDGCDQYRTPLDTLGNDCLKMFIYSEISCVRAWHASCRSENN